MKKHLNYLTFSISIAAVALCCLGSHTGTPDPDVPIGSIIAWHKTLGGVPQQLPAGWIQCDGQLILDTRSPLNGQTAPNLSGGGSFLRGNTTSGDTGGANTHAHSYSGTTDVNGSSTGVQTTTPDANVAGDGHTHGFAGFTDASDNAPPYMTVVWIMRIK